MVSLYFILIIVSCLWIMKACAPFEESANFLGRNMTAGIKGATVNAVASSTPELITTLFFLFMFQDSAGLSSGIATIAGSAIFNAMVILSGFIFAALLLRKKKHVVLTKQAVIRDGLFFVLSELILIYILSLTQLTFWHGVFLVAIYFVYVIYMYWQNRTIPHEAKKNDISNVAENKQSWLINFFNFDYRNMLHRNREFTTKTASAALLLSVVHITIACFLLAESVIKIADYFEVNTFFVAIIMAAVGTSIPDMVISIKDAMNDNYDDAASNAIGSNIFDVCICIGFPVLLYSSMYGPIEIMGGINMPELPYIVLAVTLLVTVLLIFPEKKGYFTAWVLILGYIITASYVWCRGMGMG